MSLEDFERVKEERARNARIPGFTTLDDRSAGQDLEAIGNQWTRRLFDGNFFLSKPVDQTLPLISLVFVESKDGNTGGSYPEALGGGESDKHLIYEGLSRVAADAVMGGARTLERSTMLSVWHPELRRLRDALGKPRHPAQVVVTAGGTNYLWEAPFLNVGEIAAFVITTDAGARTWEAHLRSRPWITLIRMSDRTEIREALRRLKREFGIATISVVGGRNLATLLIDEGLVRDLYLTTGPRPGGPANTPFYVGTHTPERQLVLMKEGCADEKDVTFRHFVIGQGEPPASV